jgi:autophagy-related protein 9
MADFSATHSLHTRRRPHGVIIDNTVTGTVLRLGERKQELAERAQEYDRALRQSQHAATARRRNPAASVAAGSVMANSGSGMGTPASGGASSSIWQSGIGGAAMAQTAVLGDSHGSIQLPPPPSRDDDGTHDEDSAADGGVGSELGDSYVDGKQSKAYASQPDDGDEDDEMEDGGVLGLLAQIYGTKGQGPARVL